MCQQMLIIGNETHFKQNVHYCISGVKKLPKMTNSYIGSTFITRSVSQHDFHDDEFADLQAATADKSCALLL